MILKKQLSKQGTATGVKNFVQVFPGVFCVLAILVALSGGVLSCSRSPSRQALEKGRELLKGRSPDDWEEAAEWFAKSVSREARARNQMVVAYKKLGKHYLAEGEKKLAEKAMRMEAKANKQAGLVHTDLEFFPKAVHYLEKALEQSPNDKYLHYYLGICYAQLSRSSSPSKQATYMAQAEAEYETVLNLDRGNEKALYGLAMVHLANKNYEKSQSFLNRLVSKNPEHSKAYFALARVYYEMEEYGKAMSIYRMLQEMLPEKSGQQKRITRNLRMLENRR